MQNITPTRPTQPHMWPTCGSHNPTRPHHPFRGVGGVGSIGVGLVGICNFLQDSSDHGNPQISTVSELPSAKWSLTSTAKRKHRLRARDVDSVNESTGNDTP